MAKGVTILSSSDFGFGIWQNNGVADTLPFGSIHIPPFSSPFQTDITSAIIITAPSMRHHFYFLQQTFSKYHTSCC